MKLSTALIMASSAVVASAEDSLTSFNAKAKLLRSARRLQNGDDAAQEEDYSFLANYSIKLVACKSQEQYTDPEDGEVEYGSVIFRLCPTANGCKSDTVTGCDSGYGDFEVGMDTFIDAYFEDQKDNMNWDDNFQVDRYAECAEYQVEVNDDNSPYKDMQFFIGPTCTDDELGIKFAVFSEETCTTPSQYSFEEISNGWTLPFGSGGLVSEYCLDCVEINNNGEYNLKDMCLNLYQKTSYACETNMESYSYLGQNLDGCDHIKTEMPKAALPKKGGKGFGWFFFVLVVVGIAGYIVWWRKKKSAGSSDGLVA